MFVRTTKSTSSGLDYYLNETIAKALRRSVESLLRAELQRREMRRVLGVVDDIPGDLRSFISLRVRLLRDFFRDTSRSLPIGVRHRRFSETNRNL